MPRGAKPGQRRGGRERGTPNKRTTELAEAANNVLVNAGRAPLPKIAVQEQKEEKRKVTGESARHRLLQVVLNVIAAEDAEASRRASEIETAACELEADAVAREAPITIEAKAEPAPEPEPDDGDGSLA